MSYTNVMTSRNARRVVDYLFLGDGEKRRRHEAEGTDRAAFVTCSLDSKDDFVATCEGHGRAVQCMTVVQSFPAKELSVSDASDVERCNQLGVALAERLAPGCDYLVVTHVDGASGILHNHIVIANHDLETGRALTPEQRKLWTVRKANDELMREEGLSTIGSRQPEWRHKRAELKQGTFVYELGNRVEAARTDPRSADEAGFRAVLAEHGVELEEKVYAQKDGSPEIGWVYKMRFDDGKRNRVRSRKASSLSYSFTREAMHAQFELQRMRELESERMAEQRAKWDREVYADVEGYSAEDAKADLEALGREQEAQAHGAGVPAGSVEGYREIADSLSDAGNVAATHAKLLFAYASAKASELMARKAFHATDDRTPYERDHRIAALGRVARNRNASAVVRLLALMLKARLQESDHRRWLEQEQARKERRYAARGAMWSSEKRARAARKALEEFYGKAPESSFKQGLREIVKDDTQLEYTLGKQRHRQRQMSLG